MKVGILLSVAANWVTGGLVDSSSCHMLKGSIVCQQSYQDLQTSISTATKKAIDYCDSHKYYPNFIAISLKGNVVDGEVIDKGKPLPLKNMLEAEFKIPTFLINRFQAFGLGVYSELTHKPKTVGVITFGDGVGCAIVQNNALVPFYDKDKGVGGLTIIKRHSDKRLMSIASIAGSKSVNAMASSNGFSSASFLRAGLSMEPGVANERARLQVDDLIYAGVSALSDLIHAYSPDNIIVALYPSLSVSQSDCMEFMKILERRLARVVVTPPLLSLWSPKFNSSAEGPQTFWDLMQKRSPQDYGSKVPLNLLEDYTKLLGAFQFAKSQIPQSNILYKSWPLK